MATAWAGTVHFKPAAGVVALAGLIRTSTSALSVSAAIAASLTPPLQFGTVAFAPASVLTISQPIKWNAAQVGLAPELISTISQPAVHKSIAANLSPAGVTTVASAPMTQHIFSEMSLSQVDFDPFLSQVQNVLAGQAVMPVAAGIAQPWADIPRSISSILTPGIGFDSDLFLARFIAAQINVRAGVSPDATVLALEWNSFGSQVLYPAASGLEKAMIDADAPRITAIPAESVIDTWDPYNCPLSLLPYLAWAMGVTFWNDKWSEQTKRAWIAAQWQFKSLRGTDAAIEMAVDFAGRDVSPYGYHVRDIITQPQGQYPSPGISHDAQEAWLASLPQVREYLFVQTGQALTHSPFTARGRIGSNLKTAGLQAQIAELYLDVAFLSPGPPIIGPPPRIGLVWAIDTVLLRTFTRFADVAARQLKGIRTGLSAGVSFSISEKIPRQGITAALSAGANFSAAETVPWKGIAAALSAGVNLNTSETIPRQGIAAALSVITSVSSAEVQWRLFAAPLLISTGVNAVAAQRSLITAALSASSAFGIAQVQRTPITADLSISTGINAVGATPFKSVAAAISVMAGLGVAESPAQKLFATALSAVNYFSPAETQQQVLAAIPMAISTGVSIAETVPLKTLVAIPMAISTGVSIAETVPLKSLLPIPMSVSVSFNIGSSQAVSTGLGMDMSDFTNTYILLL